MTPLSVMLRSAPMQRRHEEVLIRWWKLAQMSASRNGWRLAAAWCLGAAEALAAVDRRPDVTAMSDYYLASDVARTLAEMPELMP